METMREDERKQARGEQRRKEEEENEKNKRGNYEAMIQFDLWCIGMTITFPKKSPKKHVWA